MNDLNSLLNEYSKITDKILKELHNEEYDKVNISLENREEIINEIRKISYDSNELKGISVSLNLKERENDLIKALKGRINEKIAALSKISEIKYANSEYKKAYTVESIFINKKI